jgi:selenocysteine lyase/cysteine desulfurase
MQTSRRSFLGHLPALMASPVLVANISNNPSVSDIIKKSVSNETNYWELARDENFWGNIRSEFAIPGDFIHLENGYFTLRSNQVLERQLSDIRRINKYSSFYMRNDLFPDRLNVKRSLAEFSGVQESEIAILRNTTEGLNTVISGLPTKSGDEYVYADQDYGSMIAAFEMKAKRFGTVNTVVKIPNHPASDQEIVSLYEKAITDRTKAIHVTHMINLTGQVLPVRKIARMAHSKGVEVICDAAHSFAHLDFEIPDLECDYFATSLHKWLGAPLGTGLLWVHSSKIEKLWPLMGDTEKPLDSIEKLEHIGTHAPSSVLGISAALQYHHAIGSENKESRLLYLRDYWLDKVRLFPEIEVNSPDTKNRYGAIANISITGMDPKALSEKLYKKFGIFTVAISNPTAPGIRVTPHLFTSLEELDTLINALKKLTKSI